MGIFVLSTLNGCVQNTAFLGPAYTYGTSGNIFQAGLSYSSEKVVNNITGKSVSQNIKDILVLEKNDTEFEKLVKKNIKEARKKLNISNQ